MNVSGVSVCYFTGLDLAYRGVIVCSFTFTDHSEQGVNDCYFLRLSAQADPGVHDISFS